VSHCIWELHDTFHASSCLPAYNLLINEEVLLLHREREREPLVGLFICHVNSKYLAVTLPFPIKPDSHFWCQFQFARKPRRSSTHTHGQLGPTLRIQNKGPPVISYIFGISIQELQRVLPWKTNDFVASIFIELARNLKSFYTILWISSNNHVLDTWWTPYII